MTHEHIQFGADGEVGECVEIGEGVCLREWRRLEDGQLMRFLFAHDRAGGFDPALHVNQRCEGTVPIVGLGSTWTMTGSLAGGDLTLNPSVLCPGPDCGGSHGWVRNGKWVVA